MTRGAVAIAAILGTCGLGFPAGAHSQTRSEPRLVLSLFGGLSGGRNLWEVPRQSLLVLGSGLAPKFDTLRLSRRMNTGFVLGIAGTVFRSPRLGLSAEMIFLGLSTDDNCTMTYNSGADGLQRNLQLCSDIAARTTTPTTLALSLGGTWRPLPSSPISPFARLEGGIGAQSGSINAMTGSFIEGGARQLRAVINDEAGVRIVPTAALAAGISATINPGYLLRLELRDNVSLTQRVAGPADEFNGAIAPTEPFAMHTVTFTAGLDIVLEQKRGRRY
jgi:hypothetical protein